MQQRSQDTQKRFIDATLKLTTKEPMHLVTSKAISDEAGTAWGSAQYLFGSKEDLMVAAIRHASGEFVKACQKEFCRSSYTREDLDSVVTFFWRAANKTKAVLSHEIAISCLHDKAVTELNRGIILETMEEIIKLVQGKIAEFYPDADPVHMQDLLFVIETFFTGLHFRRGFTRPDVAERKVNMLIKLWRNELKAASS
ncbi:MAG: TetR/AcrR family transcriptional regulator [Kordiimonadaceae bacterium]|nr:TetR/AcrR family transcriptional regulator [Kordiimonadaceae bacterium]